MKIENNNEKSNKYHKETFEKISDEKRQKILNAAIQEFSSKGFSNANINIISKNADISIGSMYNYFSSKEDLFLFVINYGYTLVENVIKNIDSQNGDFFDVIENMLRAAQEHSKKYPQLTQIYLDITSEGLAHLAKKLSRTMETISAEFYKKKIRLAKEQGLISNDINEDIASFCLDNLILLLQFSYTTDYFRERMKIFAGENSLNDDENIINGMMKFIRTAFTSQK